MIFFVFLDFGTVQTGGIFCFSRFWNCSDRVVFLDFLDFGTVQTEWYFLGSLDFGTVQTVWYY